MFDTCANCDKRYDTLEEGKLRLATPFCSTQCADLYYPHMSLQKEFKLIRGERLLQGLAENSAYDKLYGNIVRGFPETKKRQHAVGEVNVSNVTLLPYVGMKYLEVSGQARSNQHMYKPSIQFLRVIFEPNDSTNNVTFQGKDGQEHHMQPIILGQNNVKVRCTCLDFYYTFATWNFDDNSLIGRKPPMYHKKTNRPPRNVDRVPGLCKHVIKLIDHVKRIGLAK